MSASQDTRKRGDWLLYLLLIGAIICLPLAIKESGWVPEAHRLIYTALWGALVGVLCARSPLSLWLSWLLGTILGMEYSIQFAGKLLPSLGTILKDVGYALRWTWQLAQTRVLPQPLPFTSSIGYLLSRAAEMNQNLLNWWNAVQASVPSKDNTALWLLVSFGVWVLTWNAGFELFRRRRTFAALLPLGAAIVANVAFTDLGMKYVHIYLAITLLTLVRANVKRMEDIWNRLGIDFSPELRQDATIVGSFLSGVVIVVALFMPYITVNKAVFFFWDHAGPTLQAFYQTLDKAFAGRNPVPEPTKSLRALQAHDLRAISVLGKETVFLVRTSDPLPPPPQEIELLEMEGLDIYSVVPKRYWRERTYDVYTGHGWENSERHLVALKANERWKEPDYPHVVVTQTFRLLQPNIPLAFAVNEPIQIDQDCHVVTRGDQDFAGLSIKAETYTVVSWVPNPTEEQLQAAEDPYPDWIKARYLQLPPIPERVRRKAQEVVQQAGARTRYEKARAIEAYIRNMDYDLNIAPPPLDADIVDYFLFEAKRGYCDYSATAMVVMLRAVGVAARYASGYNMGTFDHGENLWVVNQRNAHAWPEVYFPGYGWIEFEPTPTERIFRWGTSRGEGSNLPSPGASQRESSFKPPLWAWGLGLLFIVLFIAIWPPRWFKRTPSSAQIIRNIYAKLTQRARWLGVAPQEGQTPREYLRSLATELQKRAPTAYDVREDILLIEALYLQVCYSNMPITPEERYQAEAAWRRLRGYLWRAFFKTPARTAEA